MLEVGCEHFAVIGFVLFFDCAHRETCSLYRILLHICCGIGFLEGFFCLFFYCDKWKVLLILAVFLSDWNSFALLKHTLVCVAGRCLFYRETATVWVCRNWLPWVGVFLKVDHAWSGGHAYINHRGERGLEEGFQRATRFITTCCHIQCLKTYTMNEGKTICYHVINKRLGRVVMNGIDIVSFPLETRLLEGVY